ncbi:Diphthamide biosynthesis protein 4 [Coniosporium apollinis]|uniref:Diphthamide biosynthesis protein 4 n=2 Tax=Coniosporium TaxID=2810619 RepID=A0ABQ9P2Q5_9PEZI|nr:Diphthamide biosynthesis protein 4 [Cladosporium sp. JES 115]KAJ9668895.1 Diphthamide biosynthesis protein 4 [Coniosporium apollinis]
MGPPNHYHTLGLPSTPSGQHSTAQDVKLAYRRALLSHHPDKATGLPTPAPSPRQSPSEHAAARPTVDQITLAYKVLSDSTLRREYDRELSLSQHTPSHKGGGGLDEAAIGLEPVDLDDLEYDDDKGIWYRSCRCGQARGFTVTEVELEKEEKTGLVVVGCRGCSLSLMVGFGVVEADEQREEG